MFETNELSEREQEVLRLVATGASNKEIAQELFISTNTVKVHLRNIYSKIGVASRTEAAMYAVNEGIVSTTPDKTRSTEPDIKGDEAHDDTSQTLSKIANNRKRKVVVGSILSIFLLSIVIGGYLLVRLNNESTQAQFSSPAEIQKWKILESMPTPRFGLAVASLNDNIYAIGGQTESDITGVNEYFSTISNQWSVLSSKPTPVSEISSAVIGGKIYIPGGRLPSGEITAILEIYDPRSDEWTQGTDIPIAISAYGITSHEGKAYLFGGWDGENFQDKVFEYDPQLDRWRELATMGISRGYLGVAKAGDRIYVMGGFDGEEIFDINEIFLPANIDTQESLWEKGTPIPVGISSMGLTSIADIIYLFGGKRANEPISNALAYFSNEQEWRSIDDPLVEIGELPATVSQGTQIYVFGGDTDNGTTSVSQIYQAIYTISFPVIVK